jgi:exosortase
MILRAGALAGAWAFAFYPVLEGLVTDWWTHPEYSHAFLVPVISAYLLWRRRGRIPSSVSPSVSGLGLFAFGLAMLALGALAGEEFVQRVAVPVTLLGMVHFLAGGRAARTCLFPIGYLLLMIPIPFPIYKAVALRLRLIDATWVASWSSALGVPVFQDGYLLHLPRITLEVADSCSGTLSILALLTLGTFYISEMEMGWKRKVLVWLTMIPISVSANVIRILVVVVLVHYSGNWVLDTTFHKLTGTVNFVLGFAIVMLIGYGVRRLPFRAAAAKPTG